MKLTRYSWKASIIYFLSAAMSLGIIELLLSL